MKVKATIEINCVNNSSNTTFFSPDPEETPKPGEDDVTVTTDEDDEDEDIRPNE